MPSYEIVEKTRIAAAPDHVRAIVRDFRQWEPWSPWLSAEPDCPLTYAPDGSWYSWDGRIIGSGRMGVVSESDAAIHYKLTFLKPWKSVSEVSFLFAPSGDGTEVSWTMKGSIPFFLFFMKNQMKAWIASDYRRGLAKLKDYAESGAVPSKNEFAGVGDGIVTSYIGVRGSAALDDIGDRLSQQFDDLRAVANAAGVAVSGQPMSIYHKFDMVRQTTDYTAALPVQSAPSNLPAGVTSGRLDTPRTYRVVHTGAYRHLGSAWSAGMMHQQNKQFRFDKSRDPFERYVTDAASAEEAEVVTEIHFPAR